MKQIAPGVWPTMITPYTEDNRIDYAHVEKLVEWYIERGVAGIFAVCQSSEMFFLSDGEKAELASIIVKQVNGRVGVVASGHTADDIEHQIRQVNMMAETGADNIVLIPNRFAAENESDDVLIRNLDYVLENTDSSITFGCYECPYPYKRVLTPRVISHMADTGRFAFMKDTCCDAEKVKEKIEAGRGIVRVFNANCSQLYLTLKAGASGFSGVMANYHPEAYAWLCKNWESQPELAKKLSDFLGIVSCVEGRMYPVSAKKYLKMAFFPEMSDFSRALDRDKYVPAFATELEQLRDLYRNYMPMLGLDFGVEL
ncbi:MAG: dihydrodipicolinate synthase family protein [Clostridia bacterium]|nr:dihydrodipicolinate synthase family protein [Clostridia bacterium]